LSRNSHTLIFLGLIFLRNIARFKILELVVNPERRRRAVSPACPAILSTILSAIARPPLVGKRRRKPLAKVEADGDGGSNVEGERVPRIRSGTLIEYILYTKEFTVLQNLYIITVIETMEKCWYTRRILKFGNWIFFRLQFVMFKIHGLSINSNKNYSIQNGKFRYHRF
jgi:hypothetical protein